MKGLWVGGVQAELCKLVRCMEEKLQRRTKERLRKGTMKVWYRTNRGTKSYAGKKRKAKKIGYLWGMGSWMQIEQTDEGYVVWAQCCGSERFISDSDTIFLCVSSDQATLLAWKLYDRIMFCSSRRYGPESERIRKFWLDPNPKKKFRNGFGSRHCCGMKNFVKNSRSNTWKRKNLRFFIGKFCSLTYRHIPGTKQLEKFGVQILV
jgi:hypothetical protein